MIYHFQVHKEDDNGYWAECLELKGCVTQGDSFDELLDNMKEVLELFLDEPEDSSLDIPLPNDGLKGNGVIGIQVSPNVALALMLRTLRKKHNMTQKEAAAAMGFNGIYNYQRLEASKTANPELATLDKIRSAFPEFSIDYVVQGSFRNITHIYPVEGEWIVVEGNGNKVQSIHNKKQDAVKAARIHSKKNDGEISMHMDSSRSKIASRRRPYKQRKKIKA